MRHCREPGPRLGEIRAVEQGAGLEALVAREAVIVTGGNSGIGFACSRRLAHDGWQVWIASRNREASRRAVQRIARECGDDSIFALDLDLGSLASVRRFAAEIEARDLPLRALLCNAGLRIERGRRLSADGFELTFAVNHLGHFLLTHLLLARLARWSPARIVVVASRAHDPARRTGMPPPAIDDFDELAVTGGPRKRPFDGATAYVNSKLCNVWFAYELARRIEGAALSNSERPLTVAVFDPGLVPGSGIARDYSIWRGFMWRWVMPIAAEILTRWVPSFSTPRKSGAALAWLASDPLSARFTGRYFPSEAHWREAPSSTASYDLNRARELWDASVEMTRLTSRESPLAGDGGARFLKGVDTSAQSAATASTSVLRAGSAIRHETSTDA